MEGARGRKLFAREPEAKPRRPALLARKPSRKIAFTFFDFARARFFLLKDKAIFLRGSAAWRHDGGAERLDFFRNF